MMVLYVLRIPEARQQPKSINSMHYVPESCFFHFQQATDVREIAVVVLAKFSVLYWYTGTMYARHGLNLKLSQFNNSRRKVESIHSQISIHV